VRQTVVATLLMLWVALSWADDSRYVMRVDGLACPYCGYGVEKKLKRIDGVNSIEFDLDKGLVVVEVREGVSLSEADMRKLFNDAGFTYRSMTRSEN
jgi:mercuric ion binding protein